MKHDSHQHSLISRKITWQ